MLRIPNHVAIIMDGNGRWASAQNKPRIQGHSEGAKRVDEIVTEATAIGIRFLTLYTFSSENWNRPSLEVRLLMELLIQQLKIMDQKLIQNKIRLVAQGDLSRLPERVQKELQRVIHQTSPYEPRMTLNLALSYGGRQEIVQSARQLAKKVQDKEINWEDIDETLFQKHLYPPALPDPDLLIRTGGEYRVSNFLLWQIAYTELFITPILWPDFSPSDLKEALNHYATRKRRFGKTDAQLEVSSTC